ncbi:MAG: VOC family protein [Gemmatimonadaceae bacterium]|nr:VOC family protein [Gemmatimonadaceae bacterium]MCW5826850.1 VOC family protein [Gemmatimonadaceae bacterium]
MRTERPEPILRSLDLAATRSFYESLGFTPWFRGTGYEIVSRGNLVVHFEEHRALNPDENRDACYWRVTDADALHSEFTRLNLPSTGIPRITPPEDEIWGMREFTLKDPSGNLVRIGHDLDASSAYVPSAPHT